MIVEKERNSYARVSSGLEPIRPCERDRMPAVIDGHNHPADELKADHAVDGYAFNGLVIDIGGEPVLVAQPHAADRDFAEVNESRRAMPFPRSACDRLTDWLETHLLYEMRREEGVAARVHDEGIRALAIDRALNIDMIIEQTKRNGRARGIFRDDGSRDGRARLRIGPERDRADIVAMQKR